MKLRRPTDFLILEALEANGRNVATNLAFHTDKERKNINARLPILEEYGLVEKIGPASRSGLYEITTKGKSALIKKEKYGKVDDFEALLDGPDADQGAIATGDPALARGESDEDDA